MSAIGRFRSFAKTPPRRRQARGRWQRQDRRRKPRPRCCGCSINEGPSAGPRRGSKCQTPRNLIPDAMRRPLPSGEAQQRSRSCQHLPAHRFRYREELAAQPKRRMTQTRPRMATAAASELPQYASRGVEERGDSCGHPRPSRARQSCGAGLTGTGASIAGTGALTVGTARPALNARQHLMSLPT